LKTTGDIEGGAKKEDLKENSIKEWKT
jgi:hypothetical protein